jgi:hypothetical protein
MMPGIRSTSYNRQDLSVALQLWEYNARRRLSLTRQRTFNQESKQWTEAIDLNTANKQARAIAASVPQYYYGDIAPSDHWPVQAIYELS